MIVVGEGKLNKYRLVKRIYEYFLDSATKESYEYFSKHKDLIISDLDEPGHILQRALDKIKIDGLHCEFGVYKGDSLKILSSSKNVMWHAFDSFKGLQEDWKGGYFSKGHFDLGGEAPRGLIKPNITIYNGWFKETIPYFTRTEGKPLAFANIDCDTYESTKEVLDNLEVKIEQGTILIFDDYHSYYGWRQGQYKAWQEHCSKYNVKYKYVAIGAMSVVVEVI